MNHFYEKLPTLRVKIDQGLRGSNPPGAVVNPIWESAKIGLEVGYGQFTAK